MQNSGPTAAWDVTPQAQKTGRSSGSSGTGADAPEWKVRTNHSEDEEKPEMKLTRAGVDIAKAVFHELGTASRTAARLFILHPGNLQNSSKCFTPWRKAAATSLALAWTGGRQV